MFLPLYCLSFGLRLLITPSNFSCLYVLSIALCDLRFTASDYSFKLFFVFMFLPLYCVSFGLRLLIIPSSFSLSLCSCHWILCVLRFTASDYSFKLFFVFMFLPLYCVSFGLRLLIIPSSFSLSLCSCHCILCVLRFTLLIIPSSFSCLYALAIVLCVLRFTGSDYPFNLFLSLCSCHCIVCPSVYGFWLPLQAFLCLYVLVIVLCVLRFTASDYPFKLFFVFMFLPLYCVSFDLRLLITPSSFSLSVCSCHCIVYPSVYGFWLPLQAFLCLYVLAIVLCVLRFTASDYPFKLFFVFMFLQLYCVFFGVRLLITPSSFSCLYVLTIVLCVLRFTASDYPLKLFLSLCSCHCIVCPSLYGFWLHL